MLWSALTLGLAGLAVGLWIYGIEVGKAHPGAYQEGILQAGADAFAAALRYSTGTQLLAMLAWFVAVLWLYLVPEVSGRRQLKVALAGVGGAVITSMVDSMFGWGEDDLWVRSGVLMGAGIYAAMGLALGERRRLLRTRVLEGAVTGGLIGLLAVFAVEAAVMGFAGGFQTETRLLASPAIWGAVIGFAVSGGRTCLGGGGTLSENFLPRWPLAVGVVLVLVNVIGPVLLMQSWYGSGNL